MGIGAVNSLKVAGGIINSLKVAVGGIINSLKVETQPLQTLLIQLAVAVALLNMDLLLRITLKLGATTTLTSSGVPVVLKARILMAQGLLILPKLGISGGTHKQGG